jgi:putative flippase GtrA
VANFLVSFVVFYAALRYLPAWLALPVPGNPSAHAPIGAVANALAYLAGMVNSFLLNRTWTFRATGRVHAQALRFIVVNLGCLAAGSAVMFALVDVRHWPELWVWLPLTACLISLNYLGCKHWVFAARAPPCD